MNKLIEHLVGMTAHRSHGLLEQSAVRALHDMTGAAQVQAFEIFRFRHQSYLRARAWMQDGRVVASEETSSADHNGEPLSGYPALIACIAERIDSLEEVTANGDCMLWLPVWLNDSVSSCLQIRSLAPFSAPIRESIDCILRVYRNHMSLLDYSERDSLTGLLNRKTFDEKFSRMSVDRIPDNRLLNNERRQRSATQEQWLAVVDIDHFKRVNDQFGHLYGDEVLILVANVLRHAFRDHDRIFRFGGEEFVVLLRSATCDDAHKAFERFRGDIEKNVFPQIGKLTVSVGFARIDRGETPVTMLGFADEALYYAKEHGRNRVCSYEELVTSGALHSQVIQDSIEFFFDSSVDSD